MFNQVFKSVTICLKSPEDQTKKKKIIEEVQPVEKFFDRCEHHYKEEIKMKDKSGIEPL